MRKYENSLVAELKKSIELDPGFPVRHTIAHKGRQLTACVLFTQ